MIAIRGSLTGGGTTGRATALGISAHGRHHRPLFPVRAHVDALAAAQVRFGRCPLCRDSDQIIYRNEMSRCANSGHPPPTRSGPL